MEKGNSEQDPGSPIQPLPQPADLCDDIDGMVDISPRRILDDAWIPSPTADKGNEVRHSTDLPSALLTDSYLVSPAVM